MQMPKRKGNFIWLKDQEIRHNAQFMTIHGAPLRRDDEGKNVWVLARGIVEIDEFKNSKLKITCDGKYRLWVNGKSMGYGPYRSNPTHQRLDVYNVEEHLKKGKNQIAVLIHVPGQDLAWYETVKSSCQTVFGDGGLYIEIETFNEGIKNVIYCDENWKIIQADAWNRNTPLAGWGQDFIEEFDANLMPNDWQNLGFDDANWPNAIIQIANGDEGAQARGWGQITPFPFLIETNTPPLTQVETFANNLLWAKKLAPKPELPIKERLYAEKLLDDDKEAFESAMGLVGGKSPAILKTDGENDLALLFSFSPYQVGRPFIEIDAKGGEIIEIALSESIPGDYGRGIKGDGLRNEGRLWVSHICRYKARKGVQRFDKFTPTGIGAMQIVIRNAKDGIEIKKLGLIATNYDAQFCGSFECSEPVLNKVWEIGRHTILMCAQDGWIDCPGRESRQWLGDGIVMFDMANLAFGPSIFPMHKEFLKQICEGQRQDGLARMVSPGDIRLNSITIPDYSFHWIIGLYNYWMASGDLETVEDSMQNIELCLKWFANYRDENGLIADVPEWHFIEWANIDRKGYSMAFNALYAGALNAASIMNKALGNTKKSKILDDEYNLVCYSLNQLHFNHSKNIYVDSVDDKSHAQGDRVSQHANALSILYNVAPKNIHDNVLNNIIDDSRLKLTDAPPIMANCDEFNENIDIVRANSFFAHFVYDAIAKAGKIDWVINDIIKLFGPMIATGTTTLWEAFEPIASLCHGFSATPLYQLSRHCLGIKAIDAGYKKFTFDLSHNQLLWAKGVIPTIHGDIIVSWKKNGERINVSIRHPLDCEFVLNQNAQYQMIKNENGFIELSF